MTMPSAYIECAGVRIPADWTLDNLRAALENRKIRFANEKEVMAVFGDAIQIRNSLRMEIATLDRCIKEKRKKAICPKCGMRWFEELESSRVKTTPGRE